jgi:hypothetical protein
MKKLSAVDELRTLGEKFRTARTTINGAELLRAEWTSDYSRQIVNEGAVWLPIPSEKRTQQGFVNLFDSTGAHRCPERPGQDYQYSEVLKPAAERLRELVREGRDILSRMPILESELRPFACGPDSIAGLDRWWFSLLFLNFAKPPVTHDYNDGKPDYETSLTYDVFRASELACEMAIEIVMPLDPDDPPEEVVEELIGSLVIEFQNGFKEQSDAILRSHANEAEAWAAAGNSTESVTSLKSCTELRHRRDERLAYFDNPEFRQRVREKTEPLIRQQWRDAVKQRNQMPLTPATEWKPIDLGELDRMLKAHSQAAYEKGSRDQLASGLGDLKKDILSAFAGQFEDVRSVVERIGPTLLQKTNIPKRRGRIPKPAIHERNLRIKALAKVHKTNSPARLAKIANEDHAIKTLGMNVTSDIVRNVLNPCRHSRRA